MKLRVRIGQRTERIDIRDEEPEKKTLGQLSSNVADALRLELGNFELSLNGRDPINGSPDDLLETFGIVSGDLIKVLVPSESSPSTSSQNRETGSNRTGGRPRPDTRINGSMTTARDRTTSERRPEPRGAISEEVRGNHANPENEMSKEEKKAREQLARLEREAEMGEKISEPMLCRDAAGDKIPLRLKQLCEEIQPQSCGDALCLVLHVLMVETGFYAQEAPSSTFTDHPSDSGMEGIEGEGPGDIDLDPDPLATLPNGWKTGTSYKLPYQHAECRGAECTLAGVSMGTGLLIHGLIGKKIHATIQLKPSLYASHVEGSVSFTNLAQLSRSFKDTIVYPLLSTMRADLGLPPLHGLLALFPEIQVRILSFLDLPNLVTMSTVSNHFNSLISDPSLWRQLMLRDFGGRVTDRHCNWKNVYKERYRLKKLREQLRSRIQNSFYPPGRRPFAFVPPVPHPLPGIYPPGYRGGDYDIDPFRSGGALPGYPSSVFQPIPGPLVPNPRHDPIFRNPDANLRPGHGGGLLDLEAGRPHPYAPQPPGFPGMPGRRTDGRSLGGRGGTRGFFR